MKSGGFMLKEEGLLARIMAYYPAVVTIASSLYVLFEPVLRTSPSGLTKEEDLIGAMSLLFKLMVNRLSISFMLVSFCLYLVTSLVVDPELREFPKYKLAAIGNSIVGACVSAMLLLGVSSAWIWCSVSVAGILTSVLFRRRFGTYLLL